MPADATGEMDGHVGVKTRVFNCRNTDRTIQFSHKSLFRHQPSGKPKTDL
jgi:hypothetical protein